MCCNKQDASLERLTKKGYAEWHPITSLFCLRPFSLVRKGSISFHSQSLSFHLLGLLLRAGAVRAPSKWKVWQLFQAGGKLAPNLAASFLPICSVLKSQ